MSVRLRTEDEVEEYVFTVSLEPLDNSLGIISRSDDVSFGEFNVSQSLSLLYQHSTGGCVWNTTPRFAEWIRSTSPLAHYFGDQTTVIELGSGTGALAVLIHDLVKRFIVTDQRELLKLCARNCKELENVEIREFDWEKHDFEGISDNGIIVACDTVYNDYLINPFFEAIQSIWKSCPNIKHAVIAVQLRDVSVIESALKVFIKGSSVECYSISPGFVAILCTK